MKRILCGIMTVLMLLTSVLPAAAYTASGTEAMKDGDMDTSDAIMCNLKEYAVEIFGLDPKSIMEDVASWQAEKLSERIFGKNIFDILPEPVEKTAELLISSAYAYYDLGCAIAEVSKTRKALLQEASDHYRNAIDCILDVMESVYELGVSHRGTRKDIPDFSALTQSYYSTALSRVHNIEAIKKDRLIKNSSEYKNILQSLADQICVCLNTTPALDTIYSVARYASLDGTDNVIAIWTDRKCWFVSKSTGKNLNVYTDRAAKDLKNGDRINVYKASGDDTQEFRFVEYKDGWYRIRVDGCKKYLDIYNTDSSKIAKSGAKVQLWAKNSDHYRDQCFTLTKENGFYRIHLAADPEYCLYVKKDGYLALGKVKEGNDAQLWNIIYDETN